MNIFILWNIILLLFIVESFSQTHSYTSYRTIDGLPSNIITAIMQDKNGFIWIGTNNGLSVYNARDFKNYSVIDGLSNNWITSIVESPNLPGTIWVGTIAGGLNKFNNGKFETFAFRSDPDSNNVNNIIIDGKGILWFTSFVGFWKLKENEIVKVNDYPGTGKPENIITDRSGNIWCTENNNVYRHDVLSNRWGKLNLNLNSADGIVSIFSSSKDEIWIGTKNKLIMKIDTTGILKMGNCKFGVAYNIKENGDGWLVLRSNDILFSINEEDPTLQKLIPIPRNDEMPAEITSPFLFDHEGNLWIGTWNKGLLKIPDFSSSLLKFSFIQKLNTSAVDKYGHFWTGINGGLIEIYKDNSGQWNQKIHYLNKTHKNIEVFIHSIDNENRLWIYEDVNGVNIFKIKHSVGGESFLTPVQQEEFTNTINNKTLLNIYPDNNGRLWISCSPNTVFLFDSKTLNLLKSFTSEDNIPQETKVIFQDRQNNIWMGGWLDGICLFSSNGNDDLIPDFKKELTLGLSPENNMIRSFYEDELGNIWVGTRHSGVFILNKNDYKILKNISMKDGLLSNAVWKIIEGPEKNIWLNTDIGIEQIENQTWKVIPPKKEFLFSGLHSMINFNSKIWGFNSSEEIFIYEYSKSKRTSKPPPVYITKVLVNGNILNSNTLQNLSHTQNNVTFEFTALSFKDEKAVRYQYRLYGAGEEWTEPSEHHFVSFASLRPGSYKFEVRAINSDGMISHLPASLSFKISSPFWLQWWFIVIIILIAIIIVYSGIKLRIKRLLEIERLRLRIASDLHDDVGTNLSSIILSSQIMEKKFLFGEREKEYLSHLSETALNTQDMLKEIVWLLNPMNDSSEDLIIRMKSIASQLLKVRYSFHSDENLLPPKLSVEWKRNFILIFKEILHNIIKHSSASSVMISLTKENDLLIMKISDNGKGFDIDKVNRGNGLTNLYNRANVISGNLIIDSEPSEGTTITLEINITQMRTGKKNKREIS
ncbi:MAG TPA: two-component regulator propeller domain-containing protein [Ignavibacteriaceae bacterium]|nr:two-component regulator propeller domain-containing protein [Ignavibacteriaceae bacterium]